MKTSFKTIIALWLLGCAGLAAQDIDAPFCQILDRYDKPIWYTKAGYVAHEDVKAPGGKDFGIIDLEAGTGLTYIQSRWGTTDIRAVFDMMVFVGSGGIDLPHQVGQLNLDVSWTRRNENGLSYVASAQPGLYSDFTDFSGKDIAIPFHFSLIQAISPELSGQAGLRIFPTFDRFVDPILGIRWSYNEFWLVDLFYPESRIGLSPNPDWRFFLGWRTIVYPEYQLEDNDPRDRIMYDEDRIFFGLEHTLSDVAHLLVEVGQVTNREIDFEKSSAGADVDDGFYFSVGLGSFL